MMGSLRDVVSVHTVGDRYFRPKGTASEYWADPTACTIRSRRHGPSGNIGVSNISMGIADRMLPMIPVYREIVTGLTDWVMFFTKCKMVIVDRAIMAIKM